MHSLPLYLLAKESFQYQPSYDLLKTLEQIARRSKLHRSQAFDDCLQAIVCALGTPHLEEEYLAMIQRHKEGEPGKRGADLLAQFFGQLVEGMDETDQDLLGDLFQGAISHGEAGQFLTPECICDLMARMQLPAEPTGIEGRKTVSDPCCGSGRLLLAAARQQPNWHFIGQDIDLRCVRMTAINLALRNRYGHVIWGNTLAMDQRLIYETGRVELYGNVIRQCSLPEAPASVQQSSEQSATSPDEPGTEQLFLFD